MSESEKGNFIDGLTLVAQIVSRIEKLVEHHGLEEWDRLESALDHFRHRVKPHCQPVRFRFAGLFTTLPNGDVEMADQAIKLNTPYTGAINFTDAQGNPTTAPIGATLALDNPANGTVGLSADGKSLNVTATALPLVVTYTATNADGVALTGPTFNLTEVAPDTNAVAFDFGPLTEGTTA